MNKNKIFSAIMRGFEVSGINALSSAAGSSSVNGALQEIRHPPLIWTPHTESFLKKPGTRLKAFQAFAPRQAATIAYCLERETIQPKPTG